jgi:hypothetical protein
MCAVCVVRCRLKGHQRRAEILLVAMQARCGVSQKDARSHRGDRIRVGLSAVRGLGAASRGRVGRVLFGGSVVGLPAASTRSEGMA